MTYRGPKVVLTNHRMCISCGKEWPIDRFLRTSGKQGGRRSKCRECTNTERRAYYHKNGDAFRAAMRADRAKNPERHREYNKRSYPKGLAHHMEWAKEWRMKNREHHRLWLRDHRRKQRLEALVAYGPSGEAKCACCGESQFEFLALDHINNDGAAHRRQLGRNSTGFSMIAHLRKRGWPAGFQVLCHNCNSAKGYYGSCPHEQERK